MSWQLTVADLPDLARGATLLGTGGGGDPYIGSKLVEQVLGSGSITVLDPGDPDDLPDDAFVIPTAQMGAPTVMIEKLPAGTEPTLALRTLEEKASLTHDLSERAASDGYGRSQEVYSQQTADALQAASLVRQLLERVAEGTVHLDVTAPDPDEQ